MATTWTVAVDWNRDGDYSDTYDDVTSRVITAEWFLGIRQAYKDVADNATLTMTLNNSDKLFSSENSGSPLGGSLVPFRPVKVTSDDGVTERIHWLGWIESIRPVPGKYGKRQIQIVATGPLQFYTAAETSIELQEDQRTDQIIAKLIEEVVMPPALSAAWVLGREGNSELDETTHLADIGAASVVQQGALTLGMAADNWIRDGGYSDVSQNSFDVYRGIRDITAAERGRFFFDRDGRAVFWNRQAFQDDDTIQATFDDSMVEMGYDYAGVDDLKNEVIITCHPRTISSSDQDILWQLGNSIIRVAAGQSRSIYIKYEDESSNRIGAKDVTVTDLEFESGSATASVEAKANGAELLFTAAGAEAIINKCIVRGRKITDEGQIEAKATDQGSIIDYGRRTLRINLPSIDNLEDAQYIADYEVNRRKEPIGFVRSITTRSHSSLGGTHHADQLNLTMGDLVRVKETQTAHDANYYIIGEAYRLTQGSELLDTTWYLEPAPEVYPWKLDAANRHELGVSTILGF